MSLRTLFSFHHSRKTTRLAGWIILIAGIVGAADSFFLVLEYIAAIVTQGEPTPCSPSSIVNCTKTVQGAWAHLFVVPNPMLGMLWYSGWILFGAARLLGTDFSKHTRIFAGIVAVLGIIFSYILYLASVLSLRGVCPFCLTSTTASTLVLLAFLVDETSYDKNLLSSSVRTLTSLFQLFSIVSFVIGLPVFLAIFIPPLLHPIEALTHWSFPVMVALILIMGTSHVWTFKALRKN